LDRERAMVNNQLAEVNHELSHINQDEHMNAGAIRDF
jgi:hypothetical protein